MAAAQTAQVSPEPGRPQASIVRPKPQSVGVADSVSLWPGGIVYYQIDSSSGDMTGIMAAIDKFNADFTGVIQWQEGTGTGTYVEIYLDPGDNSAAGDVNTIGYPLYPPAVVNLNCAGGTTNPCSLTTLLHEMGHVVGLYHEFTRTDRDSYVTVNYDNVIKGTWPYDFAIQTQDQQLLSPYDYASVMQYPPYVDTRNGGPVIESIPAGIPMQGLEGVPGAGNQDYSAGDKETINRLYGHAPTSVTITSNPVGLEVSVDGTNYTTPVSFPATGLWALGTSHTLDVPSGVQTLTGDIENTATSTTFYYNYGRWSDSTAQSHSITVAAGDGTPAFPSTSPAIATYSADFIQLVPYTEMVTPSGEGSVSVSPQPQTYAGATGNFFVARQEATLTATPISGWSFYEFNAETPYLYLPGGLSANPKTFYVPDIGNPVAVNAQFTNTPVYTVNAVPADPIQNEFNDGLYVYVDGVRTLTPQNFSSTYNGSAWTAGNSTHTLNIDSPELPYSVDTEFTFSNWSDGGAQSHGIASLPAASTTYTATVTPQYQPATNFGFSPCGGSATITPASTNGGFYPWGTQLNFTATPGAGWTFAGWTYDLTGTTNPASLTAKDETLVFANFNVTDAPLTITSLSPSSVPAGSSTFTLTITGTGFTTQAQGTNVVINGNNYPSVTYVSPTEIQVQVDSSVVTNAATFDVAVENFPPSSSGCAVFAYDTFAVTGSGTGSITPTINWSPVPEIVFGDAGASVLNATTTPPNIGNFTYSATPTGGGSAIDITAGTSTLPAGKYTVTATLNPTNPQYSSASAHSNLTVAGETVWIVNGGAGGLSELTGDGAAVTSSAYAGANRAAAIDAGGNVWTVGTGSPPLEETSQVGIVQNSISSGGGLDLSVGIAIDGNSQIWVTNNDSVSLFSNAGAALSPSTGFTDSSLSTPSGIAIDLGGSVWIANTGNSSVTRILGAAAPAAPLSTAAANKTTGAKP
jgi:hypothetical protein